MCRAPHVLFTLSCGIQFPFLGHAIFDGTPRGRSLVIRGKMEISDRPKVVSGLSAEVAFAVLPLLVVLMVFLDLHHSIGFFASPEWSFGAAILFGQSFIRLVTGLVQRGKAAQGPVALIIAMLLVFGLTPSIVA